MQKSTIKTEVWGQPYELRADWADASSEIEIESEDGWSPWGRQAAEFGHEPRRALRAYLEAVAQDSGDDPSGPVIRADIESAINRAVEEDS